nr:M12 family metallo-peptidase [Acidobacteriota bacterium]
MKTAFTLLVSFALLAGSSAFAQKFEHNHRDIVEDGVREDGSVSIRTVDPFGNKVRVVVEPKGPVLPEAPYDNPEDPRFVMQSDEMDYDRASKARVNIDVYACADEEYRAAYSNWTSRLNQIIETADNAYVRDFDINWIIQGYYSWTSSSIGPSGILSQLASAASGLPNGLVMGFTRDSSFNAGGIAYVYSSNPGLGTSVCLDQGTSSTIYALRHEAGHNYGCGHDASNSGKVCMMNYTYAYSVDYFDSAHDSLVNSHR